MKKVRYIECMQARPMVMVRAPARNKSASLCRDDTVCRGLAPRSRVVPVSEFRRSSRAGLGALQ